MRSRFDNYKVRCPLCGKIEEKRFNPENAHEHNLWCWECIQERIAESERKSPL